MGFEPMNTGFADQRRAISPSYTGLQRPMKTRPLVTKHSSESIHLSRYPLQYSLHHAEPSSHCPGSLPLAPAIVPSQGLYPPCKRPGCMTRREGNRSGVGGIGGGYTAGKAPGGLERVGFFLVRCLPSRKVIDASWSLA